MLDKTKANLVGYWRWHVAALGKKIVSPQEAQEFPTLGWAGIIRGSDCVNDVRGQASNSLVEPLSIRHWTCSASLPADIETRKKPLSRFRG